MVSVAGPRPGIFHMEYIQTFSRRPNNKYQLLKHYQNEMKGPTEPSACLISETEFRFSVFLSSNGIGSNVVLGRSGCLCEQILLNRITISWRGKGSRIISCFFVGKYS